MNVIAATFKPLVQIYSLTGEAPVALSSFNAGISTNKATQTVAFVGAGGKSTALLALAEELLSQHQSVVVTTTTRMWLPLPPTVVDSDLDSIKARLVQPAIVWAGHFAEPGKISGLSDAKLLELSLSADWVLIEADGSKGMPIKTPEAYEPVIPSHTTQVVIVVGLSAIGQPLGFVSHRLELVEEILKTDRQHIITPVDMAKLIRIGYLDPLHATGWKNLTVLLNQADNLAALQQASEIAQILLDRK